MLEVLSVDLEYFPFGAEDVGDIANALAVEFGNVFYPCGDESVPEVGHGGDGFIFEKGNHGCKDSVFDGER